MKKTANLMYMLWHTLTLAIRRLESDEARQKRMENYKRDKENELKTWKFKN